jgi:hypothetical protein
MTLFKYHWAGGGGSIPAFEALLEQTVSLSLLLISYSSSANNAKMRKLGVSI